MLVHREVRGLSAQTHRFRHGNVPGQTLKLNQPQTAQREYHGSALAKLRRSSNPCPTPSYIRRPLRRPLESCQDFLALLGPHFRALQAGMRAFLTSKVRARRVPAGGMSSR